MLFSLQIPVVKRIAAFRQNLGGCVGSVGPSRICRICTAEHRRFRFAAFSAKNFPLFTAPQLHVQPFACDSGFLVPHSGRIFRLPSRRTADNSSFRRQAWVPFTATVRAEFFGNTALSTNSSILQQLPGGAGCAACCCAPI